MTLPETLRIGSYDVEVKKVGNKDLDSEYGSLEWTEGIPLIRAIPSSPSVTASTLFHEALHFISDICTLRLTEYQVLMLELMVPATLRDNPALWPLVGAAKDGRKNRDKG